MEYSNIWLTPVLGANSESACSKPFLSQRDTRLAAFQLRLGWLAISLTAFLLPALIRSGAKNIFCQPVSWNFLGRNKEPWKQMVNMPRNMYKVQKHISKKRGQLDSLYENSRDAKRLRRAVAREEKLGRVAARTMKGRKYYGE
jgi:hypothetical protein